MKEKIKTTVVPLKMPYVNISIYIEWYNSERLYIHHMSKWQTHRILTHILVPPI